MKRSVIFYAERVSLNLYDIRKGKEWTRSTLYKTFLDMLEGELWQYISSSPADHIEISISCYDQE